MPNLKAYLCNCLIGGHKVTQYPDGGWVRDRIELNLSGYDVILKQKKNVVIGNINDLKGNCCYTTDVIIRNVSKKDRDKATEIVMDISILLSMICESWIGPLKLEYPEGSGLYTTNSFIGATQFFRPVLEIRDGEKVYNFIQLVWKQYQKVKKKRKIKELVHYLCLAELPENPVELQLIIAFTMLENLKDTWARSKKIPFVNGFFRKVGNNLNVNLKKTPSYRFKELLRSMLKDMKMKRGLERIVGLRNDLIHSGLSRRTPQSQLKTYEVCRDIIREYLLRLLGYSGKYHPYSEPNIVKKI